MKVAIISDIHSNLEALTECVRVANEHGVEKYVCLGDFVGYGPEPAAVMDMLLALPGFTCIVGNHEEFLFDERDNDSPAKQKYAKSWTLSQLSEAQLDYISRLSYIEVADGVTYVHATTHEDSGWVYINNTSHALKCLQYAKTPVVFYGHVHVPMIYHEKPDKSISAVVPERDETLVLQEGHRYVINTGSVGQPRDNNPDSSFVIYDTDLRSVTFYRVAYDIKTTAEKIRACGLVEDSADRLLTGR
ncbi:MAG: metallophosphatase family protein [Gammaproteobacteria bacterium]|nr:metallophosphatase family protein [Gammaproteobacteria bacterium]MDH5650995.1 metallophosphatase family protein [Gammaproteobacteria bacterium]